MKVTYNLILLLFVGLGYELKIEVFPFWKELERMGYTIKAVL
ncbi:hypothetical protein [Helicobacter didelphidarum]|nr:hypothetical protein [Helicobacter didelphidarum]